MFENAADFGKHLGGASAVAVGKLSEWDGAKGVIQADKVLHGQVGKKLAFTANGGIVRARLSDKVVPTVAAPPEMLRPRRTP